MALLKEVFHCVDGLSDFIYAQVMPFVSDHFMIHLDQYVVCITSASLLLCQDMMINRLKL